jgi:glycerol-3-phosphate dehydrogenase
VFFVLPYQSQALIGTAEVGRSIISEIKPTKPEVAYLIYTYNHYLKEQIIEKGVVEFFSGIRSLIKNSSNSNKITRECATQVNQGGRVT